MSDTIPGGGGETMADLAPAYVLGALSPEETRAFEAALAGSAELQREVAEYRELSALLAAAEPGTPPSELKQRLLERVRREKSVALDAHRGAGTPVRSSPRLRTISMLLATGLAAAALVAVGLTRQVARLTGELRLRDSVLAERDVKLAEREATLNAILEPGVQLTTLTATGEAPPIVQVFWDHNKHSVILHTFRLKPAPSGRAYQLWLMPRKGGPIASRVFNTEPSGHQLVQNIPVPSDQDIIGFALTEEPASGSVQPTTTPFLFGNTAPSR